MFAWHPNDCILEQQVAPVLCLSNSALHHSTALAHISCALSLHVLSTSWDLCITSLYEPLNLTTIHGCGFT
ncbi:unnamed protein product [Cercopithifilaria johnstoni]|uniref:Uncharacterized protein n=1 Tax=Cercopithifilaria johnstoni TaxID=2874296 RepID=A0A8J2MC40_9BILA|nr:unnamed protein product [Cercopithifilaria johnstoni]